MAKSIKWAGDAFSIEFHRNPNQIVVAGIKADDDTYVELLLDPADVKGIEDILSDLRFELEREVKSKDGKEVGNG